MEKLKVLKEEQLFIYTLQENLKVEGVIFQKRKGQWYLVANQQQMLLKEEGIIWNQITFALYRLPSCWSVKKLQKHNVIGRDPTCSIVIEDETISSFHFQITNDHLEDLQSTNGTYCNDKRIRKQKLNVLDHLWFGTKEAYYLPGYLVLGVLQKQENVVFDKIPELPRLQVVSQTVKTVPQASFLLQSPQPLMPIPKGHWFQSMGSSLLILISGLVSAGVVWISSPQQSFSVVSLMINAISMGLAFGAFGLWNRKMTVREKKRENQALSNQYSLYCKRSQNEMKRMQKAYQSTVLQWVEQYQLQLLNFQREAKRDYRLWIGYQKREWIQLQYRKPNYLQEQDRLFQQQEILIQSIETYEDTPVFLEQGQQIHLPKVAFSWIESLFLEWLLVAYQAHRKWVWVDASMSKEHPFFNHEACIKDTQKLLIQTKEEWLSFIQDLDQSYEYTFIINEAFALESLPSEETCICFDAAGPMLRMADFCQSGDLFRKLMLLHQEKRWDQGQECKALFGQDIWHFSLDSCRQNRVNLKVCLGFEEKGTLLYLDLQESKQGPHGFLAGKTGSGKSEMLRNILLQLVVQNSPKLFQYILIDFKGGAFGQYFMHFPHCQGMLTNLEKDQMERFDQSLQAFLEKRQKILQQFNQEHPDQTAHIDVYNAYNIKDPLAHVFLIVDELAQLKQSFPDFLMKIKEIARIGRSLGVHCILSTQKPLGVMDDQIWANMDFKICMSVATTADSYEVLHSDHAYALKRPGDFILQDQQAHQRMGRAWYLQKEIYLHPNGYCEVDENGNIVQSYHQEKTTLFHFLSQQINKDESAKEWIIHPFDQSVFKSQQLALIDEPSIQQVREWAPQPGQCSCIYCTSYQKRKELIQSIVGWTTLPVYGLEIEEDGLDACLSEKEFGRIQSIRKSCIWLVDYTNLKQKDLDVLKNDNVILFLFLRTWDRRLKEWFLLRSDRICYDLSDIEDLREFFGCFIRADLNMRSHKGYIFRKQSLYPILFQKREGILKPKRKEKAYTLHHQNHVLRLGWDSKSHQEVFWQRKHPLLICYVQRSMAQTIADMLEKWQTQKTLHIREDFLEEADIYVLHAIYNADQFQTPEYLSKIYDLDVCWIGQGIQDYLYVLKRSLPQDHSSYGAYWTEQEVYSFNR